MLPGIPKCLTSTAWSLCKCHRHSFTDLNKPCALWMLLVKVCLIRWAHEHWPQQENANYQSSQAVTHLAKHWHIQLWKAPWHISEQTDQYQPYSEWHDWITRASPCSSPQNSPEVVHHPQRRRTSGRHTLRCTRKPLAPVAVGRSLSAWRGTAAARSKRATMLSLLSTGWWLSPRHFGCSSQPAAEKTYSSTIILGSCCLWSSEGELHASAL